MAKSPRPRPRKPAAPKLSRRAAKPDGSATPSFPIVGIGASAGGLEAMTQLLKALPPKPGAAFVLVQHLDPKHESAMASLLARSTAMPVVEARNHQPLEPNHVYIIPPNKLMVLARRRLILSPRPGVRDNTPIDYFFESLAHEEGSRAIGVVLSGSGGFDGTQGCLAIKSNGGITFAQDGQTAKYPNMPAAAIAAACVDFVLPPEKIAHELATLAGHPYIVPSGEQPPPDLPAEESVFHTILVALGRQTSVDFTQYKHATLRRRIQRRMALHKLASLKEYAAYLNNHPPEIHELFNDILIHVTGFFRDRAVFEILRRKVYPRLLKEHQPENPIRVWVPGCSTGEEVYSLAISLLEYLSEKRRHSPVQIFGTDINDIALEKARAGFYPSTIDTSVSADRLRRFFIKADGGYRISKVVREMCIFARQNLVADPPFSNLDLISCRNVLIYLGPPLQRKALPLFHYALRPAGFLLLGISETIGGHADLFALLDNKAKLYAKKETRLRPSISFGHMPAERARAASTGAANIPEPSPTTVEVQKYADRIVLAQHSPAGVVINRDFEVLQFRGQTGPYLEHAHGDATLNLLKMAREGLMAGLRSTVNRAIKQNIRTREEAVPVRQDGEMHTVNIEVLPFQVPPGHERFFLVLFEPRILAKTGQKPAGSKSGRKALDYPELNHLREELASTRESLQATIEEQEATNEELRSANEEIMSSNEELQSTNEELETAKEELQSSNEELATLNDELESRNTELEQVNNDLHNLLSSVNIPVVMVGSDLRIRRFTTVAERVFNLIPADVGRPLTDINLNLAVPRLGHLVAEVIESLQTRELEVQDSSGQWWSARIRPYKTADNKIDGAVIALVDIDALKKAMNQVGQRRAFAEAIVNTVRHPLVVLDENLVVRNVNQAFYRRFQVKPDETINHRIYELVNGQWDIPRLRTLLEDILPRDGSLEDFEVDHLFPHIGQKKMLLNARRMSLEDGDARLILLAIEEVPAT